MKVGQLLAKISGEVGAVAKDQQMSGGSGGPRYNFRGIDAVVNACHARFVAHEVAVIPSVQSIEYADILIGNQKKPGVSVRVVTSYTFVGPDGDTLTATVAGEGQDQADKGTAKAQSVAMRVALLQALMLPTDEPDPDSMWEPQESAPPPFVLLRNKAIEVAVSLGWTGDQLAAEYKALGGSGKVSEAEDVEKLKELLDAVEGAAASVQSGEPPF